MSDIAGLTSQDYQLSMIKSVRSPDSEVKNVAESAGPPWSPLYAMPQQTGKRPVRRANCQHHSLFHGHVRQLSSKGPCLRRRYALRAYGRLALICLRLCKTSLENLEEERDKFLSVFQVLDNYGSTIDRGGVFFDPDDFKANVQSHLPHEARRLLQMDCRSRTDRDIAYLLIILRNISTFAEYPTRMQKMLCKVGWYESYEPRRAIIREGHAAHSFYFILSGTVLVTRFEPQSGSTRTLVSLEKGLSFGELAVATGSRRQATVTSKTHVELLCISAWDFEKIFMAGGIKTITDPNHNTFLRSVSFLKYWPIEQLTKHPHICLFHYFNRGQVLVRDSNNSDWIYIVKSGSLSVLKKLPYVQATSRAVREQDGLSFHVRRHGPSRHATRDKHERRRTSSPEVFRNQMEADRRLEQCLPGVFNTSERLGTVDYDRVMKEYRARVLPKHGPESQIPKLPIIPVNSRGVTVPENNTQTPENNTSHPVDVDNKTLEENEPNKTESGELREIRPIIRTSKGVYLAPNPPSRLRKKPVQSRRVSSPKADDANDPTESSAAHVVAADKEPITSELSRLNADYQRRFRERLGRKTLADQLDVKGARDFRYSEVDFNPMFVLIQVLERSQHFDYNRDYIMAWSANLQEKLETAAERMEESDGMYIESRTQQKQDRNVPKYFLHLLSLTGVSQLLFPDQPSLCLVSNGAELIVLSKRLFLEQAGDACLRHVRHTDFRELRRPARARVLHPETHRWEEYPYPSDQTLQNRLHDYVNWEAHRARIYRRLVTDIRQRQIRKKQYLPSIPGRCCFRSGPL